MYILASKFRFLEFSLLLSRVAPYYSLMLQCVLLQSDDHELFDVDPYFQSKKLF